MRWKHDKGKALERLKSGNEYEEIVDGARRLKECERSIKLGRSQLRQYTKYMYSTNMSY